MKYLLGLILITALFPKDVRAEIFGSGFSLHIGVGGYEKSLGDSEENDESYGAFSGMISIGYKQRFLLKHFTSFGVSARVQANLVADLENRHLYSVLGGVSVHPQIAGTIRLLGGYGYSFDSGSGYVFGIEFGMLDIIIMNMTITTNSKYSYLYFSIGFDILSFLRLIKSTDIKPKICDGGINPSKDCPHFPALYQVYPV